MCSLLYRTLMAYCWAMCRLFGNWFKVRLRRAKVVCVKYFSKVSIDFQFKEIVNESLIEFLRWLTVIFDSVAWLRGGTGGGLRISWEPRLVATGQASSSQENTWLLFIFRRCNGCYSMAIGLPSESISHRHANPPMSLIRLIFLPHTILHRRVD